MSIRIEMIKHSTDRLSISRACELLSVARGCLYYKKVTNAEEVWLMNLIRDIWLKYPFYGYRKITRELRIIYDKTVNMKCVLRLMRKMQIQALYRKPRTSIKQPDSYVYPYLLTNLIIDYSNHVWMIDITYLRLGNGFVYLVALIDVYSRFIVGWHLSYNLDSESCIMGLYNAFRNGKPDIINSDQGTQFTSAVWVDVLIDHKIKVSMTGQGRCIDNIYIERLWRSIKYEAVYLNDCDDFSELKKLIKDYVHFYNYKRYHQSLDYEIPAEIYFDSSAVNRRAIL